MDSIYWLYKPYKGQDNGLGYSIHNNNMYEYTKRYMDVDDPYAEHHLQIVPADQYFESKGKKNILFSMWEFPEIPESYKRGLAHADHVLVPCNFCADIFRPYTKHEPIVVFEGIEPKDYPYYQRKEPNYANGERFRVLWAGARNTRKGYQHMLDLIRIAGSRPDMEFYIKTHANLDKEKAMIELESVGVKDVEKFFDVYLSTKEVRILGEHKNIYFDMRKVSKDELRGIYNSAHCFLFSTHGEGWGLMGTEVLATGCPLIAPMHTGVKDWFDSQVGFPITYHARRIEATNYGDMLVTTYEPDISSILEQVFYVKHNYQEALRRGKTGSKRMHNKFTWDIAGQKLAKILKRL